MALQIIAWMSSGLFFSLFPITEIRGEHLTRAPDKLDVSQLNGMASPADALNVLDEHIRGDWELDSARLITMGGSTFWRVEGVADNRTFTRLIQPDGQGVVPMLSAAEAERKALDWMQESVKAAEVEWLESSPPGSEFRGRNLPVWKVSFEHPEGINLYLDPWTGELLARRTDRWRIFDFFWMLHIMDFDTRDDFNHLLLQIASALGLIIALSGVVYWTMTTKLFRRRNVPRKARA